MLGREKVDAVLRDAEHPSVSPNERALFTFVRKAGTSSWKVTREDLDALRALGWDDDALYDAISVIALFKFYNTWIDSTGVRDLPSAAYGMMARRMATAGYVPLES